MGTQYKKVIFVALTTVKRRKLRVLLSRIYSSRKPLSQTSGIPVQVSWWVRQHWNLPFS